MLELVYHVGKNLRGVCKIKKFSQIQDNFQTKKDKNDTKDFSVENIPNEGKNHRTHRLLKLPL